MINVEDLQIGNSIYDKEKKIVKFYGLKEGGNEVILNYANGSSIYYNKLEEVSYIPISEYNFSKTEGFVINNIFNVRSGYYRTNQVTILNNNSDNGKKNMVFFRQGESLAESTLLHLSNSFRYVHEVQQLLNLLNKK